MQWQQISEKIMMLLKNVFLSKDVWSQTFFSEWTDTFMILLDAQFAEAVVNNSTLNFGIPFYVYLCKD